MTPDVPAQLSPAGLPAVLEAYLAEVRQRTGSARTPQEYARYLQRFFGHFPDPPEVTAAHVHAFAYGPGASGRDPSPGMVNMRLNAIRGFYSFAVRMGLVAANPADGVRRPKLDRGVPRGLSVAELQELLAAVPDTHAGTRDRAIILTMVLTGLRRSEVLGLRLGDLTRDGRVYFRVRAKGGIDRHRELPAPAFAAIVKALERSGRPIESLASEARLFDVSAHGFYLNLKRYARTAKLAGVAPHSLRHTAAKLRRETGASIEDVQSLLGHTNLATTARYLQRLEGSDDEGWQAVASAPDLA